MGIWVPRLALLWLAAFPLILFVNAELLLYYFMATVYLGMMLLGWGLATVMFGNYLTAAVVVLSATAVFVIYALSVEKKDRAESHGLIAGPLRRRAKIESLPTYAGLRDCVIAGALAGMLMAAFPILFYLMHQIIGGSGGGNMSKELSYVLSLGSSPLRMAILLGFAGVFGGMLGRLRKTSGFAKKAVWLQTETYVKERPKYSTFDKLSIYWSPFISGIVFSALGGGGANLLIKYFYLWIFSGLLSQNVWSFLQRALLIFIGAKTARRLDYEYLVRIRLENEQDLHSCRLEEIVVKSDGEVRISGVFDSDRSMDIARNLVETTLRHTEGKVAVGSRSFVQTA